MKLHEGYYFRSVSMSGSRTGFLISGSQVYSSLLTVRFHSALLAVSFPTGLLAVSFPTGLLAVSFYLLVRAVQYFVLPDIEYSEKPIRLPDILTQRIIFLPNKLFSVLHMSSTIRCVISY